MALTGTAPIARGRGLPSGWWLAWAAAGAAFAVLWLFGSGWTVDYPKGAQIPAMRWVGDFMKWLVNDATFGLFTFVDMTRFIAALIDIPYWIASSLFATGFMTTAGSAGVQITPPVSWIALIGTLTLIGHWAGGWKLAALTAALMLFIALFGQWSASMVTLASIAIAVPLGVVLGLLLGILCYRLPLAEKAVTPVLDLMQTVPVFAYLVPLFGFGPTAAIVATIIYAMPPMTRLTIHALRAVPAEIDEPGRMVGATPRQRTWRVLVPAAMSGLMVGANQVIMLSLNSLNEAGHAAGTTRWQLLTKIKLKLAFPEIMLGLNQTIMLALSMLVITALVGTRDLGQEVYIALAKADTGRGIVAGLAVAFIAIIADRLISAGARRTKNRLGLL